MPTNDDGLAVRRAGDDDAALLTAVLAEAFMDDPVSVWLFSNEEERRAAHPDFFRAFVDLCLEQGEPYITRDSAGVALFLPVGMGEETTEEEEARFEERIASACGRQAERFRFLIGLMNEAHPIDRPHQYLAFIGVLADQRNTGHGTALIRNRLDDFDQNGVASYLEASSPQNGRLYHRLGYRPLEPPISLPGGPALQPMWRSPRTSDSGHPDKEGSAGSR
jgi:ribosomal protein S18 acetylase RimI-like enzyme